MEICTVFSEENEHGKDVLLKTTVAIFGVPGFFWVSFRKRVAKVLKYC